jgi:diguanylate cyclase (GGDEF)-like protein
MTYTSPIIIVLGTRNLVKEIQVLDAGAEDFIAKPFPPQVLAARIHTSIRRNFRLQVSNPLTGLPGAIYIEEQASRRLDHNSPVAMCYADLDYFKAFNDKYGYNRGDNVIRILATILNEGVSMFGRKGDFVGHVGGDDFVMIIHPDTIDKVCQYVTKNFDTLIPFQYDEDDMDRGYIQAVNRQGETMDFPLMTVSIGVVSNENKDIKTYLDMTELAAEMKEYAKSISKSPDVQASTYRVDQRQD